MKQVIFRVMKGKYFLKYLHVMKKMIPVALTKTFTDKVIFTCNGETMNKIKEIICNSFALGMIKVTH